MQTKLESVLLLPDSTPLSSFPSSVLTSRSPLTLWSEKRFSKSFGTCLPFSSFLDPPRRSWLHPVSAQTELSCSPQLHDVPPLIPAPGSIADWPRLRTDPPHSVPCCLLLSPWPRVPFSCDPISGKRSPVIFPRDAIFRPFPVAVPSGVSIRFKSYNFPFQHNFFDQVLFFPDPDVFSSGDRYSVGLTEFCIRLIPGKLGNVTL